ncbi:RING-H2 finger protein ATL34 [Zea mays]|jgi:hypothetical protein|nr:RING-H2 finger protein ATL34 [Zea mays]
MENKVGKGVLECVVCLTAFEDDDDLRLLPHCSHAFHLECIDPWLQSRPCARSAAPTLRSRFRYRCWCRRWR